MTPFGRSRSTESGGRPRVNFLLVSLFLSKSHSTSGSRMHNTTNIGTVRDRYRSPQILWTAVMYNPVEPL